MKCPKCGEEMKEGTAFVSGSYGKGIGWIDVPLKDYKQKDFWEKMHTRGENIRSSLWDLVWLEAFRCTECKILVLNYG